MNPLRGEVSLPLDGRTVVLRPTFSALLAAEQEIGSLFQMLDRAGSGDVRLTDISGLFWHCAADPGCDRPVFEGRLLAVGAAALLEAYRALLGAIFGRV